MADDVRRVQALHARQLHGGLPDQRDHPDRVRHRLHPARRLQRVPRLHLGLPVRRDRASTRRPGSRRSARFCYDRLQGGLEPACAKACPTQSIQFGDLSELRDVATAAGPAPARPGRGQGPALRRRRRCTAGCNAFFLLMDKPEAYGLPNAENAVLPSRNNARGYLATLVTAVAGRGRARSIAVPGQRGEEGVSHAPALRRAPQWTWYIVFYFFLGGLAGGAYVIATLLRLMGDPRRRGRGPARLPRRVPRDADLPGPAHPRPRPPAAVLAHAGRTRRTRGAQLQVLVADVGGRVGTGRSSACSSTVSFIEALVA